MTQLEAARKGIITPEMSNITEKKEPREGEQCVGKKSGK